MSIREAFVLAAGLGTRMRPLTEAVPKPAIPFLNRPILHWILDSLEAAGVERVIINLHHLPQAVRSAADSHGRMEVRYSFEPEILGTAGCFHPIRGLLQGEAFYVVNGDVFHDLRLGALEDDLRENAGALASMALRPGSAAYTGVALGPDTCIKGFGRGPFMFAGIYAARAELLRHLPPEGFRELVPDLLRPLLPSSLVRGVVCEGPWEDLGSPSSFLEASMRALRAMAAGRMPVPAGSRLEMRDGWPLLRHERAWISRDATLTGPAVLGEGVRVEARAHLGEAVLLPGSAIGRGDSLFRAILHPTCTVRAYP